MARKTDQLKQAIIDQYLAGIRDLLPTETHLPTSRPLQSRLADSVPRQQQWLHRINAFRLRGESLRFLRQQNRSRQLLHQWPFSASS